MNPRRKRGFLQYIPMALIRYSFLWIAVLLCGCSIGDPPKEGDTGNLIAMSGVKINGREYVAIDYSYYVTIESADYPSSTYAYLIVYLLEPATGKVITNTIVDMDAENAGTFVGFSNRYLWHQTDKGYMAIDLLEKNKILYHTDIVQKLEQENPPLKNNIAKVVIGNYRKFQAVTAQGDIHYFNPVTFKTDTSISLYDTSKAFEFFTFRGFAGEYTYSDNFGSTGFVVNDTCDIVLGPLDENMNKSLVYYRYYKPGADHNPVTVAVVEAGNHIPYGITVKQTGSPFYLTASALGYKNGIMYIKHATEVGANAEMVLTAYDAVHNKTIWQSTFKALGIATATGYHLDASSWCDNDTKLLISVTGQDGYPVHCIDMTNGKLLWKQ